GLAPELVDRGAHGVQVNAVDHDVEPASGLRINADGVGAIVSLWIDSAVDHLRTPFDETIARTASGVTGYLVTESVPLPDLDPAKPGVRTPGFAQLAFFTRPAEQQEAEWLDLWHNSHTHVAIATQTTFVYVQNVVTRVLTPDAPRFHAIVEECFPAEAMSDPHVFFDAVGDDERLQRHQHEMFESVQRFIDLSSIRVVPTSRYVMR